MRIHDMWKLGSCSSDRYYSSYVSLQVDSASIEVLKKLNEDIATLLNDQSLPFALVTNFHTTLTYLWECVRLDALKIMNDIVECIAAIHLLSHTWIDPNQEFDETFHRVWMWQSPVNARRYTYLYWHNSNSAVAKIKQNLQFSWEPHISLCSTPYRLDALVVEQIKDCRDNALLEQPIGLDFSSVVLSWKEALHWASKCLERLSVNTLEQM